jgi:hypothetical protein
VRFRPLPETRVANTLPGLLLAAICVNVVLEGNDIPRPLVWTCIVLGLTSAVRGFRMAVVVVAGKVTVRGFAWSRTVPMAAVVAVSDGTIPALRWSAPSRRVRSSPIVAFMNAFGGLPRNAGHNREGLRLIRREIARGHHR